MSTTDRRPRSTDRIAWSTAVVVAAVVLLAGSAALAAAGLTETAAGMLCGGGATLAAAWILRLRARRSPQSAGSASRLTSGSGDERDLAILRAALAWVGLAALVLSSAAALAVALGADAQPVLTVLVFAQLAVFVTAFALVARRS